MCVGVCLGICYKKSSPNVTSLCLLVRLFHTPIMSQSNMFQYLLQGSLLFWEEGVGEYVWAGKAYFICSAVSNRQHSNIYNETFIEWWW